MPIVIYDGITFENPQPPLTPGAPCPTINAPNITDFQTFIVNVMGISNAILNPNDPVVCMAFTIAMNVVNQYLACTSPPIYTLAVYNLAGSNVINYAQDQSGAPDYQNGLPFFAYLRQKWNISGYISGTIQSSSDVSTSESMVVPEYTKDMNLYELQLIKDPFGRQYLALAQNWGPLWGMN
jgi:hypothetical protein